MLLTWDISIHARSTSNQSQIICAPKYHILLFISECCSFLNVSNQFGGNMTAAWLRLSFIRPHNNQDFTKHHVFYFFNFINNSLLSQTNCFLCSQRSQRDKTNNIFMHRWCQIIVQCFVKCISWSALLWCHRFNYSHKDKYDPVSCKQQVFHQGEMNIKQQPTLFLILEKVCFFVLWQIIFELPRYSCDGRSQLLRAVYDVIKFNHIHFRIKISHCTLLMTVYLFVFGCFASVWRKTYGSCSVEVILCSDHNNHFSKGQ